MGAELMCAGLPSIVMAGPVPAIHDFTFPGCMIAQRV